MPLRTIGNGVFGVVADDGDTHLGGEDFDRRVRARPATRRPLCWRSCLDTVRGVVKHIHFDSFVDYLSSVDSKGLCSAPVSTPEG